MVEKLEVIIDVILHATEDHSKIFAVFNEKFGLREDEFLVRNTTGHFDNPITVISIKITKKKASDFIRNLTDILSKEQIKEIINEIDERTVDSRFHIRIDKQEFVRGNIVFREKDAIKIKIHTPVYNKKNTVKIFTDLLQTSN